MAKCFTHFLHVFYDEACALSIVNTPSSYLALHIVTIIVEHLHDSNHFEIFQLCIESMKEFFLNIGEFQRFLTYIVLHASLNEIWGLSYIFTVFKTSY